MKRLIFTLLMCAFAISAFAQDSLKTIASYDLDLGLNRGSISIWIPTDDGFVLVAKPPGLNMHILHTDKQFQLIKYWKVEEIPGLEVFRYIGHRIEGKLFSFYYLEAKQGRMGAYQLNLDEDKGQLKVHEIPDERFEKSLFVNQGNEDGSCGLLRYYKRKKEAEFRYYRFDGNLDFEMVRIPVEHEELIWKLDGLESWMAVAKKYNDVENTWTAFNDLSSHWEDGVLRVALNDDIDLETKTYFFDFRQETQDVGAVFPFPTEKMKEGRISSQILGDKLFRVTYIKARLILTVYDNRTGDTLFTQSYGKVSGELLLDKYLYFLKAGKKSVVDSTVTNKRFHDLMWKQKHFFVGLYQDSDNAIQVRLGAGSLKERVNIGNTLLSVAIGGLAMAAGPSNYIQFSFEMDNYFESTWAEFEFVPNKNELFQFSLTPGQAPPYQVYFGAKEVVIMNNHKYYLAFFDRKADRYVVQQYVFP